MSFRDELYSKEATLINNAKRELANGLEKDTIYKLRLTCFAKGATGILDLAKCFRKMDKNSTNFLSFEKFVGAIKQFGIDWNQDEIGELFNSFVTNQYGDLNINEFISKIRPSIAQTRLSIIKRAFERIDTNNNGVITVEDLKNAYCCRDHPKYLSGDLTETEILGQFLNNFAGGEDGKKKKATITKEDFINYYATISASIDNDAYFDLVMRRAYKL